MTKQQLIESMYKNNQWGLTKKATGEVVNAVFDNIAKAIKKERHLERANPQGPQRSQSPDRSEDPHQGFQDRGLQAGSAVQDQAVNFSKRSSRRQANFEGHDPGVPQGAPGFFCGRDFPRCIHARRAVRLLKTPGPVENSCRERPRPAPRLLGARRLVDRGSQTIGSRPDNAGALPDPNCGTRVPVVF